MKTDIQNMCPNDFFELLRSSASFDNLQIFIKEVQKWIYLEIDGLDYTVSPSTMGQYGVIYGRLLMEEHASKVGIGVTVSSILGNKVRCEIIQVDRIQSVSSIEDNVEDNMKVKVSILFSYKNKFFTNDWTDTSCKAVPEIDELIERDRMLNNRKKSIFDILDLD